MAVKIAVQHVTVKRQQAEILSGVSFSVPTGGRLVVAGPSGAGKTTLLRLLNRLEDPAEGRVMLDEQDLRKLDPITVRRRVGMVFQQPFLFDRTVEENLAYPLTLMSRTVPHDRAVELMGEVGLPEDFLTRQSHQLSGGQQQRVAIARALALEPEVLLLDEPTSALDEESAGVVMDTLMHRNAEKGLTLVVVTHSREIMLRLDCPTILVINKEINEYPDPESALQRVTRAKISLE